jgi:hypothetical protein
MSVAQIFQEVIIMAKGDGPKNETKEQRAHRMRGIVVSDEEVAKQSIAAPSMDQIHALLTRPRAGKPPCFKSREELSSAIESYFNSLIAPYYDEHGNLLGSKWIRRPTIGGLAIHLCCDRMTISNYGKDERYFEIIKGARDIIHAFNEEMLSEGKNVAGAINTLVNMREGWVADERTIKVEPVPTTPLPAGQDEITAFLEAKSVPDDGDDA